MEREQSRAEDVRGIIQSPSLLSSFLPSSSSSFTSHSLLLLLLLGCACKVLIRHGGHLSVFQLWGAEKSRVGAGE